MPPDAIMISTMTIFAVTIAPKPCRVM